MNVPVALQVKGSLRRKRSFWRSIGAPKSILSVVQDGYRLLFDWNPSGNLLKNKRSSLDHPVFVEEAII